MHRIFNRIFKKTFHWLWNFPREFLMMLISIYQKTLSPDHGLLKGFFPYGFCKFEPSCSQYMKEQLAQRGVIIGVPKGLWQILKCNPCSKGNRV